MSIAEWDYVRRLQEERDRYRETLEKVRDWPFSPLLLDPVLREIVIKTLTQDSKDDTLLSKDDTITNTNS